MGENNSNQIKLRKYFRIIENTPSNEIILGQ